MRLCGFLNFNNEVWSPYTKFKQNVAVHTVQGKYKTHYLINECNANLQG